MINSTSSSANPTQGCARGALSITPCDDSFITGYALLTRCIVACQKVVA